MAFAGTPLLEIGDPRDLEIVVDVLSTDAVDIRSGAEVAIEHWGGQGELSERVRRFEPAAFIKVSTLGVEGQRVNVLVDLMSPAEKWAGFGDAFQVDARINVFAQVDATIVPTGALFRRGENWTVYVVKDGVPRSKTSNCCAGPAALPRLLQDWRRASPSLFILAIALPRECGSKCVRPAIRVRRV